MTAARAEKSTTVQRSYAQAAASVAKYTSEARVAKLVEEAVGMYTLPGQLASAMLIRLHSNPQEPGLSSSAHTALQTHSVSTYMPLSPECSSERRLAAAALPCADISTWKQTRFGAGDKEARLLSGMLIRELQKQAAEAFSGQSSQVSLCTLHENIVVLASFQYLLHN